MAPLIARGRRFGVITWVSSTPDRRFSENDLALLLDLSGRAALVIDNAQLYEAAQREPGEGPIPRGGIARAANPAQHDSRVEHDAARQRLRAPFEMRSRRSSAMRARRRSSSMTCSISRGSARDTWSSPANRSTSAEPSPRWRLSHARSPIGSSSHSKSRFRPSPAPSRRSAARAADCLQPAGERAEVHRPRRARAPARRTGGARCRHQRLRHRRWDRCGIPASRLRAVPAGGSLVDAAHGGLGLASRSRKSLPSVWAGQSKCGVRPGTGSTFVVDSRASPQRASSVYGRRDFACTGARVPTKG